MTSAKRGLSAVAIFALFALVAALALPIGNAGAADHVDAPGLLQSPGGERALDINDLYVFGGAGGDSTVLALTVSPDAGGEVIAGPDKFAEFRKGSYHLRIDTDGDVIEDITYTFTFINLFRERQVVLIRQATGDRADWANPGGRVLGVGFTDRSGNLFRSQGEFFTGLRSDPFFFDLFGFLGTVEGDPLNTGRTLGDGNASDPFLGFNTLAIVLEVPDSTFDGPISVWGTTSTGFGKRAEQLDRMGRPAINTVVTSSLVVGPGTETKAIYNSTLPRDDVANYFDVAVSALQIFSGFDPIEGSYTDEQAAAIAGVLLPDVLPFDKSSALPAPLNGRALADDVIDTELRIVTGGDPLGLFLGARDSEGGVNSDDIDPHTDYLPVFPYLGEPVG